MTENELHPITNGNYALAILWDIFGDITSLLDSLDEDIHEDRPELFAKFKALAQYLDNN